jgi:imidazolonepropionase-like amidohydrolase
LTLLIVWIASALSFSQTVPPTQDAFVITNVRIFDGHRVISRGSVLVQGGRIAAVGSETEATTRVRTVDGTGNTLLPGLIDAHTHVSSREQLRQALVFGVTTELDMGSDYRFAAAMRQARAAGSNRDAADMLSAGTLATAPGGHPTESSRQIPTLSKTQEAQAFVDARIAEGSEYIKVIWDEGSITYGRSIPALTRDTVEAIIDAAHARGELVTIHPGSQREMRSAIEAGADGFAHLLIGDTLAPDFGTFAAQHGVFVTPTLTLLQSIVGEASGKGLLEDSQLAPYLSPTDAAALQRTYSVPGTPAKVSYVEEAIRQLQTAGVPILAGTDAPNVGIVHGASLHREIELLVNAGLTPTQALIAATSAPAKAFGLVDRGEIAVGKRADLVLVRGDPTARITATRNVVAIWKAGIEIDRAAYRSSRDTDRELSRVEELRKAAEAEAARKGTPPPGLGAGLISDFESGTLRASFGTGWVQSMDSYSGGNSTAVLNIVDGGADGSKRSLRINGEIAPGANPAYAGVSFTAGVAPNWTANLSSRKALRFWARGDGRAYTVTVYTPSNRENSGRQTFAPSPEWREFTFPLSAFGTDGHDVSSIRFAAGPPDGRFSFQIDEVKVE